MQPICISKKRGEFEKSDGKSMITTEHQRIILYAPTGMFTAVLAGLCLLTGCLLPFLAGWQLPVLFCSLFFIFIGGAGLFIVWKMAYDPILVITAEGVGSSSSFLVKWEEIDALYSVHARGQTAFAVDITPAGILSFFSQRGMPTPRRMDVTVPQQALLIPAANLPLPVDQLLTLIREQFSAELERYHIELDDGQGEEGDTMSCK